MALTAPSGWPLRTRIVLLLMTLLATVAVVIGGVSLFALDRFLTGKVEQQVTFAASRSQQFAQRDGLPPGVGGGRGEVEAEGRDGEGPRFLLAPGQAAGTLGVRVKSGQVVDSGRTVENGSFVGLSAGAQRALAGVPVDGATHHVHVAGVGEVVAMAVRTPDGDVLVTGLSLEGVRGSVLALGLVVLVVTLSGLVAAAIAGTAVVRAALRPLERTAAAADRVAGLPLDSGAVSFDVELPDADPRTEVGRVDAALARMLDHVGRAFAVRAATEVRMRRFVSDASHELRTPLASIRGYAELTRRTGHDLPPDVAHALRRVESEAQRMTGLVEELLLLARLDEKRSLRQDEVDLTAVVVDAVSDAHAAGPDHAWELDLPEEPVTVTGDAARLHQVVVNLLTNARVHTPAGTSVKVSVGADGRSAVVEVVDDGPGIPADLLPEVFDRFTRGDASRGRAAGSTGLGLAIVAGVVEAHGGTVDVTSEPGHTAFRVVLPLPHGVAYSTDQDESGLGTGLTTVPAST